jgi:branched-chain amino acid transport system permease protein
MRRAVLALLIVAAALALLLVPQQFSESSIFNVGNVLIFAVAAMGLHLLVNWTGELSLAHSTFVGFPAFLVASMSARWSVSPIWLIPLGIAVGAGIGAVVGLAALRARGVQVALVTLAAGVAIEEYFFDQEWLAGPAGGTFVSTPTLGGIQFTTSKDLFVVIWVLFLLALVAMWMIYRSKVGRGLQWVKSDPSAAAASGVPVAGYRMMAYSLAGAMAGLAGAMTTVWVQQLTPASFPQAQSFTYLLVVVLAGPGWVGGVLLATVTLFGVPQFISTSAAFFNYLGPVSLILTLTMYKAGLNGFGRDLRDSLRDRFARHRADDRHDSSPPPPAGDALAAAMSGPESR